MKENDEDKDFEGFIKTDAGALKIVEMFNESNENKTIGKKNITQVEDSSSLSECEIYLVPISFFGMLCIYVILVFLRYRICAE